MRIRETISGRRRLAVLLAAAIPCLSVPQPLAQPTGDEPASEEGEAQAASETDEPVEAEEPYSYTVTERPYEPLHLELQPEALPPDPVSNLGEILERFPGIASVRRAASATEPVIRGLGWERVQTQVGSVPIHGACPGRMDPPVTYLPAHPHGPVTVAMGIPSVTLGPSGIGGRIVLSPDYERVPTERLEWGGWIGGAYDSAYDGWGSSLGTYGGAERVDVALSAEGHMLNDYTSGDGVVVPANSDRASGTLNLGIRPRRHQRLRNILRYAHESDVDFPALPMDNDSTDLWLYEGGYRVDRPNGSVLERIELSGGFSLIDHLMNNENKPNRGMMEAETPARSSSVAGSLRLDLEPTTSLSLATGAHFNWLGRDATRTRRIVTSGSVFEDHLWPDATQWSLGPYVEGTGPIFETVTIRGGARLDLVASEIGDPDGPSLGGRSIGEQYVATYGEDAADTDRLEVAGAANAQLEWFPSETWTAYWGLGVGTRAAGITERYFAFAPSPGGFLVGNPALSPEAKVETVAGLRLEHDWLDASLSAYTFWVADYILPTRIDERDVDGDGSADIIRGFRNVSAYFAGGELAVEFKPTSFLSIPTSLAYTYGQNRTDDRPVPEIPPLMGQADVRLDFGRTYAWWISTGVLFALEQGRVDELFPENETPGYALLRAGAGLLFWSALEIEAVVENLLDAEYHPHLSREAALSVGDLASGQEVPAPGRRFLLSARWIF